MRALIVILGAAALLVGVGTQPASAGKGTDIEQFIKLLGHWKFAINDAFAQKPKSLCVCQDGGPGHTQVGALVYDGQLGDSAVTVLCYLRDFNVDGSLDSVTACDTFEILSK